MALVCQQRHRMFEQRTGYRQRSWRERLSMSSTNLRCTVGGGGSVAVGARTRVRPATGWLAGSVSGGHGSGWNTGYCR